MATQRIKNIQIIQQPYQRTSNQIHNLQAKDKILHSSIISLRDRIQNSRNERACKGCKIYEDEIAMMKKQQKQKTYQLEAVIKRLEEQNKRLAEDVKNVDSKQPSLLQKIEIPKHHSVSFEHSIQSYHVQRIMNEANLLSNIDEASIQIQSRQKRQRQILNRLRKKKEKTNTADSKADYSSNLPSQILQYLSQLENRCAQLQQLKDHLQAQLLSRDNSIKQQSLKIGSFLSQIDNLKKNIISIEKVSQAKCEQMEQQRESVALQLSMKQKSHQNQVHTLKSYIQASNRIKQSLNQLKQAKELEIQTLKNQKSKAQLQLAKTKAQLQHLRKDRSQRQKQIANLSSSLSSHQANIVGLQRQLSQCKLLYEQVEYKSQAFSQQINNLKQINKHFQLKILNGNQESLSQIEYLRNMLNQNYLLVSNKQDNIHRLQQQVLALKQQNKILADNESKHLLVQKRLQQLINEMNKLVKQVQKQKTELIRAMQTIKKQKQILEQQLKKQVESKSAFANKFIRQAEKNSELYQRYSTIERQFEQFKINKSNRAQSEENKEPIDKIMKQLASTNSLLQELRQQSQTLKANNQNMHLQLTSLRQQLQLNANLKTIRQRQIQGKSKELQQVIFYNNQMYQDIEHFRAQNHFLANKLRELQHVLMQLQQQNKQCTSKLQQNQHQRINLIQSINSHQITIRRLEKQSSIAKQDLQQIINTQRDQILIRREDIKEQQKTIEQYKQTSNFVTKVNTELQNKNQKYLQQKLHIERYANQLQQELSSLKKVNQQQQSSIMKEKEEHYGQNASKTHDEMQKQNFRIIQLQDRLSQLQHEYNDLKASLDKANKKNQMLIQSQSKSAQNIIYLNQKIQSLNKIYLAPNGQSTEELLKELNKKKQLIAQLLTNFKYMEKALNNKEAEFSILSQKFEKSCKLAGRQKLDLQQRLTMRETELNVTKRQKEQQIKRLTIKVKQMQKSIAHLQDLLKQKDRQQLQEKRHTQKQINRIADEKKKIQQTSCKEIMHLRQTLQSQKKRSGQVSINTSPVKHEEPKSNFKKHNDDSKRRILELQQELRKKQGQIKRLQMQNEEKTAELQEINQLLIETEVHLDVKTHQVQKHQSKITHYENQIQKFKSFMKQENSNYQFNQAFKEKGIQPKKQQENSIEEIQGQEETQ